MTRKQAKYAEGLNEFSYCASLNVSHPSFDPATVSRGLGLQPTRMTQGIPNRRYKPSVWTYELPVADGDDLPSFLYRLVELLTPHRSYLEELSDRGAEIECFVGIFADRLCDQIYPHALLAALAELRVNLRLDFYGANDGEIET
jgi:hypothetical protein